MIYPIRIYDDPILDRRCSEVDKITESIKKIADNMIETMAKFEGIGLAANQVGIDLRIIVVDPKPAGFETLPFVIINPEIENISGELEDEEGCLSIPGYSLDIKRAKEVKVKGLDIEGKECVVHGEDLLARVLQHEIDHINGKLILEYSNGKV